MKRLLLLSLLFSLPLYADTLPATSTKAKVYSGDGSTAVTATGSSLNVNVTNQSGSTTVNQGTAGVSPWLFALPTGACSETGHLQSIDTKLTSPLAVTGSFYQTTQPVSGTFWQSTQPVSGALTCNAGTGTFAVSLASLPALSAGSATIGNVGIIGTVPVSGTFFQSTQPVSAASLPLPTGAATASNQTSGNTTLTAIAGQLPATLGSKTSANSLSVVPSSDSSFPVTGTFWQTTQPVSGSLGRSWNLSSGSDSIAATQSGSWSFALPTGASTSALQTALNAQFPTTLGQSTKAGSLGVAIASDQTLPVTGTFWQTTQPVSGTFYQATQPVSGTFWQTTQPVSVATLPALTTGAATIGAVNVNGTVPVSGTFFQSTQPVSLATAPLATGASTSANQTTANTSLATIATNTTNAGTPVVSGTVTANAGTNLNTSALALESGGHLASLDTKTPVLGQATMVNSQPVTFASDQTPLSTNQPDLLVTGAAAQTAIVNNILTTTSGTAATDASGYRSGSVQVVSTGTAGTFILEGSNDNVNFQTTPMYNQLITTGTPIIAAVTATSSQLVYSFPIKTRYVRLRIATAITGGSIQAFTRISQESWSPAVVSVANSTAANLQATVTGTVNVGTLTSVTSAQTAIPGIIADVASAALTTTTTTATLTPTFGSSYSVDIPVTVVSGTTPTLSVAVQESPDTGTNWYTVYTFPTITATGSYTSPLLTLTGNRVRYVQTVTGTTPSFTRAINRLQSSQHNFQAPGGTSFTDRSGTTSGTPSTSTLVAAANPQRRYFIIQNLSATTAIYINFTSAANTTTSLYIAPLGSFVMESGTVSTESINVISTGTSIVYSAKEG